MSSDTEGSAVEPRFYRESGLAGEIAELAEPVIEDLGFRLVRVVVSGRDGGTVQIMADHAERDITVDECGRISRELVAVFDAYDAKMRDAYRLELSSPGLDRPLVRPSDVERNAGSEAKVELKRAVDGRKKFRGQLDGFEDGELRLVVDLKDGSGPQVLGFARELIESAKLVLTDELLNEALKRQESAERNDAGSS